MLALMISLMISHAHAEDWFCSEEAAERTGDVIQVCGIGESTTEDYARKRALSNALEEFRMTCEISADCRGRKITARPKRTNCKEVKGLVKCYRMVEITFL